MVKENKEDIGSTDELRKEVRKPGRLLLFVDDSGTPNQPFPPLVENFKIYSGIIIESDKYNEFSERAYQSFSNLSLSDNEKEFHSSEIVSGKNQWKGIKIQKRLDIINQWGDFLNEYVLLVPHLNIGSEQYNELCETAKNNNYSEPQKLENGLQTFFYKGLLENLDALSIETEIIIIQDEPRQNEFKEFLL